MTKVNKWLKIFNSTNFLTKKGPTKFIETLSGFCYLSASPL